MNGNGLKILVYGANGLLGRSLSCRLDDGKNTVIRTSKSAGINVLPINVRDKSNSINVLYDFEPNWVIYCAAIADVDLCQTSPKASRCVNIDAPLTLSEHCKRTNAQFVYFSTDYVFSGEKGPYNEDDHKLPINVYGKHKSIAEEELLKCNTDNLIIRTSQIYCKPDENSSFVSRSIESINKTGSITASRIQTNSPTNVDDIYRGLVSLLCLKETGIFHLSGPETITRYDAVRKALRALNIDPDLCLASESKLPQAPRPQKCGLNNRRAKSTFGYDPKCISQYFN